MRVFLNELGLSAFVKTSGGKGLHVVVPLKRVYDWNTVKAFSQAIVVHLARTLPPNFRLEARVEEPRRRDIYRLLEERLHRHDCERMERPSSTKPRGIGTDFLE